MVSSRKKQKLKYSAPKLAVKPKPLALNDQLRVAFTTNISYFPHTMATVRLPSGVLCYHG